MRRSLWGLHVIHIPIEVPDDWPSSPMRVTTWIMGHPTSSTCNWSRVLEVAAGRAAGRFEALLKVHLHAVEAGRGLVTLQ